MPDFRETKMQNYAGTGGRRSLVPIQRKIRERRIEEARFEDLKPTEHVIQGKFLIQGAGEANIPVNFPVYYLSAPHLTFGGELPDDSPPVPGLFPTISVVVLRWELDQRGREENESESRIYYRGANLGVVTTGPEGLSLIVHWQVSGLAISNPVTGGETTEAFL